MLPVSLLRAPNAHIEMANNILKMVLMGVNNEQFMPG
jgi:hypothetical protein